MDYYAKYLKYKKKYLNLKKLSIQEASGHGKCTHYKCNCDGFIAENFNQKCTRCEHCYKTHKLTISDWMMKIYNLDKIVKQYMKPDYCNLNSCTRCSCKKFSDNLIDDKCKSCNHNVLNHCNTYMDIL
jgi:hypothetical protein